ncbi:MAG: GH116 family glycosyl hydrolase [Clostridiales bacterium]|nr:GH116 family glycosyl hydrolase [Clostridiales bacterium]
MFKSTFLGKIFIVSFLVAPGFIIFSSPGKLAAAEERPSLNIPYSRQELLRLGRQRVFEGLELREVAFPLGGIGTGTVSLGGRGNLRDWEIFNRPGKGVNLPFTFFALYFEPEGGKSLVRVLEGPLTPPFTNGHGINRGEVPGLPRMEKARFLGEYPFAWVSFEDSKIPLEIVLEAFSPFIPLKPEDSGIPAVILRYRIKNLTRQRVKLTVVGSIMNPVGFDGEGDLTSVNSEKFGQNLNQVRRSALLSGLFMSSKKAEPSSPVFGTLALATTWKDITYVSHWERGAWWDDLQMFWDDFSKDGRLRDLDEETPSPDKRTDIGSLGLLASLGPFEEVSLPFILSWNFPNVLNTFDIVREQRGGLLRNLYAGRFSDAWASASYLVENLDRLEKETRLFHDLFFSTTLPPYVLDAVSSQASTIRTTTCLWLEGGKFFGFEGCNARAGCCPLNCTHVWNYAQSLAFLFPSLERSMRETDFLHQVQPDGAMIFRTSLPLGSGVFWKFKPAADGQMGRIISLYRDWQISGDDEFLKRLWPQAKKALEYAWTSWDKDKDGIMEGEQHNTYDIEFYGPNSMMSGFYLGALLAGSKMAERVGDKNAVRMYQEIFEKGRKRQDELLWNGEYYVQKYERAMEEKYQYGEGCLSDQVLGQWLAMVAGLGRFLPEVRVRSALQSVFRHNFRTSFRDYSNCQRTYALGDEKGLLLCSWPKGGRPPLPFVYSDEVWTGIEYQVASHLIYEGLLEEGLTIVKAVRERHDGWRRNPWDEVECGHHYARAMSSWALLPALSGCSYSGVDMTLGFSPMLYPEDFRTFWISGAGWGDYYQKGTDRKLVEVGLSVAMGELELKEFSFCLPPVFQGRKIASLKASLRGQTIKLRVVDNSQNGRRVVLRWEKPVTLKTGDELHLDVKF